MMSPLCCSSVIFAKGERQLTVGNLSMKQLLPWWFVLLSEKQSSIGSWAHGFMLLSAILSL